MGYAFRILQFGVEGDAPLGQPIIPFPTGRNLFLVATRHFVPGYLHSVLSGSALGARLKLWNRYERFSFFCVLSEKNRERMSNV
jgi:hypothetical protein